MRPAHLPLTLALAALAAMPPAAGATTLTMEPVFNRAPGTGPMGPGDFAPDGSPLVFVTGLHSVGDPNAPRNLATCTDPGDLSTCELFAVSTAPGVISNYAAGFPRDEGLVGFVRFFNNTDYDVTSFTLQIVGSADEFGDPDMGIFDFVIHPDPTVSAFWGDVDGDGHVGVSDIFSTVTVSPDGRTITFSDGLIPVGGRFTDFMFSMTDTGETFKAGVHAWFDGDRAVPEPATALLLLSGLAAVGVARRRSCCP